MERMKEEEIHKGMPASGNLSTGRADGGYTFECP